MNCPNESGCMLGTILISVWFSIVVSHCFLSVAFSLLLSGWCLVLQQQVFSVIIPMMVSSYILESVSVPSFA